MDNLQEKGINVRAVQCDISDKGQVETVLLGQLREMPAVVGVIHSAMILRVSTTSTDRLKTHSTDSN